MPRKRMPKRKPLKELCVESGFMEDGEQIVMRESEYSS